MRKVFSFIMIALMSIMTLNAETYGIIVNGNHYFAGTENPNPGDPSFQEWMVLNVPLKSGDVLALYDESSKASWAVTLDQASINGISKTSDTQYSCTADGCYDFYIKLKDQSDQLYVGNSGSGCSDWGTDISNDDDTYYIKNCWDSGSWEWKEMTPNQDKSEWKYTGVYGGTGVNIGVQVDDPNALWFSQDEIQGTATMGTEVTFTYNVAAGTVTAVSGDTPTPPTPTEEGFGIIINGSETVKGWKNEGQTEYLEYMIESDLTVGTTFQLYDFGNQASWTEQNIDEASTPNVTINASGVYEVAADGHYTIYLKMYGPENNQVYIGYTKPTSIREAVINAPVKKMMVDGIFYIVKDNKAYTAHGF